MSWILKSLVNFWTEYSEPNRKLSEEQLIYSWGKIRPEKVKIANIPISNIEDDTIHCIEITSSKKPAFVLVPAYGASGALYYKLMQPLSEKYDLYFVDMRGMGW